MSGGSGWEDWGKQFLAGCLFSSIQSFGKIYFLILNVWLLSPSAQSKFIWNPQLFVLPCSSSISISWLFIPCLFQFSLWRIWSLKMKLLLLAMFLRRVRFNIICRIYIFIIFICMNEKLRCLRSDTARLSLLSPFRSKTSEKRWRQYSVSKIIQVLVWFVSWRCDTTFIIYDFPSQLFMTSKNSSIRNLVAVKMCGVEMRNVYTFDCMSAFNVLYSLDLIVGVLQWRCSRNFYSSYCGFTASNVIIDLQFSFTYASLSDWIIQKYALNSSHWLSSWQIYSLFLLGGTSMIVC